jgi:DNA recombination protein RmuC
MTLYFLIGIAVVVAAGFGLVAWILYRHLPQRDEGGAALLLQNQLQEIQRTLDRKLGESTQAMQEQSGRTLKIVRDVTERLTKLDETNRQVVNFADQLKSLQDILKNPKQRGILGEYYLQTVLKNVLPPGSYEMQYSFADGTIVDAIVRVNTRIIPVDSKFSLENYNRILEARDAADRKRYEAAFVTDLKNRINETAKYVKPEENTMDFAFMFIPSEAVFYDLLVNKVGVVEARDLIEYAFSKRVIVVSPTSFLAYLQTVLQGLKNQKVAEEAQEIIQQVARLGKHIGAYEDYFTKVGKNLGTTVGAYNQAYKELGKIDKDVLKISGSAAGVTPTMLERPAIDEHDG